MVYQPCKFLVVPTGKRITKNDHFACAYVAPRNALPVSVTNAFGYTRELRRCYVNKEDCAKCPCFTRQEATHD